MKILAYGGQVTLIGLLVVFSALFILIACIKIMSAILGKVTGSSARKAAEPAKAAEPVKAAKPVEAPAVEAVEEPANDQLDPQVVAVIAAAIAEYDKDNSLVIRSIRRSRGWQKAAHDEAVARF